MVYISALAVALFDALTILLITQTKAQNIPLYLIFRLQMFFLCMLSSYIPPSIEYTYISPPSLTCF